MRLRALFMIATCCTLALCSGIFARTRYVPGEYRTLAAANDSCRDGDTVMVAAGLYSGEDNTNIIVRRRVIWMSEEGATETVIDGEQHADRRGFYVVGNSTNGTQIDGFRFTRMTMHSILDSITTDTRIANCIVDSSTNAASQYTGVGIKTSQAQRYVVEHCIFRALESGSSGAGLFITSACTDGRVWDCIFEGCNTRRSGAGLFIGTNSDADIGNCIFKENFASGLNGGGGGLGIAVTSDATIHNCTFLNNTTQTLGGGVYKGSNSNPVVINSIFWGNSATTGNQLHQEANGGTITVSYCTVQNAANNTEQGGNWNGQHITTDSPTFAEGRQPAWGSTWFFLDPESPCVDAGSAQASEVGMDTLFTNPDFSMDQGVVDLGFHYDLDSYLRLGSLHGTVTWALDGAPLPGCLVRATRRIAVGTDENGDWAIRELKVGPVQLKISHEGFLDSTVFDTLEEGENIEINIALMHTVFLPSIEAADVQVVQDGSTQVDFIVSNPGSGTLQFTATPRLVGEDDREPWVRRESFNMGATAEDDRLNGFCLVDSLFYVAGSNGADSSLIYIFDRNGALLDSFEQAAHSRYGIKQMAYDGELIWGSGDSTMYGFTKEGFLAVTWRAPANPTDNIAWDPERQVLWLSGNTTNIWAYDRDGNPLDTIRNPQGFRKYGMEYWADDPDGYTLYILNRPTGNINNVTKMNPETHDTLFVKNIETDGDYPLTDCKIVTYDLFSVVFISLAKIVRADGGNRLDIWQLAGNTSWMQITPRVGEVPAGGEQPFSLVFNMMGFPPQRIYEGQIVFTHNALDGEYRMPTSAQVFPNRVIDDKRPVVLPDQLAIKTVSPNPFNGSVRISINLPAPGLATLGIYDLAGREVTRLENNYRAAGTQTIAINAETWPSGIYIAKLSSGGEVRTAKMALMK